MELLALDEMSWKELDLNNVRKRPGRFQEILIYYVRISLSQEFLEADCEDILGFLGIS